MSLSTPPDVAAKACEPPGPRNKKAEEDKALLKELLEGFGLDIPPELKDPEAKVIKSIKTP